MSRVVLATARVDHITVLPATQENTGKGHFNGISFAWISFTNNYDTWDSIKSFQNFPQEKVFSNFDLNTCILPFRFPMSYQI